MVTVAVASGGLVLEGVWQKGAGRGAVIAPPHPEYGGSLEHPVVSELAYGLYKAGIASLRFNWRGVGASQGRVSGEWKAAEEDYSAAVEQVAATMPPPIVAAGYSFGAAAALRVGSARPAGLGADPHRAAGRACSSRSRSTSSAGRST